VQVYGIVDTETHTGIVMELMKGDLKELLRGGKFAVSWSKKAEMAKEIVRGLYRLHKEQVCREQSLIIFSLPPPFSLHLLGRSYIVASRQNTSCTQMNITARLLAMVWQNL
jgi:hypothetical protein